jgi:hypothetical protein
MAAPNLTPPFRRGFAFLRQIDMDTRHLAQMIARPIGAARVSGKPHDDIIALARELAKRAAREDHEAEIAARLATNPVIEPRP